MSKANPRKAVRAVLPVPITTASGCTVRPLTLGMYAVLERISSPLLGETPADGALSLLPSLYALTHKPAETLADGLYERALAWADTLPPAALVEIKDAAERQIRAMLDVVPEPKDVKKKVPTDGSPSSRNGARKPTDGTLSASSGERRRAPSRSSGASGCSPAVRTNASPSR